jgi:hypothetical protein
MPRPPVKDPTRLFSYADAQGTAYQFGISTMPPEATVFTADEQLEQIRAGSVQNSGKIIFTRKFFFDATPAIEFIVTRLNNINFRYFVFVRGEHYYVLTVTGTEEAVASANAERFLTSFRYEPSP